MENKQTESVNENLEAALSYAAKGWAVIPVHAAAADPVTGRVVCTCGKADCPSPGKHPVPKNGVHGCSTSFTAIRQWWSSYPLSNVGIVCGKVSGIAVLDIDPRNGGFESLKKLKSGPSSLYTRTGGGGMHVFFAYENGIEYPKTIGEGLDIRADGAYIVAPPSLHVSGKRYSWGNSEAIASFDWLGEQIKRVKGSNGHSAPTRQSREMGAAIDEGTANYANHVLELAVAAVQLSSEGKRNDTLNREAYSLGGLVGAGVLDRTLVRDRLYRAAKAAGLEKREIESCLDRSLADGIEKPRTVETLESTRQMYLAKRICSDFGELTVYDLGVLEYWKYAEEEGIWKSCTDYEADHALMRMHGMPAIGPKGPINLDVTYSLIKNVTELVKRIIGKVGFFDAPSAIGVPFKNGVVTMDGTLEEHSSEYRFTSGFDFAYRPEAKCPMWLDTIKRILPEQDSRDLLQEMFGATMFRLTSRYQRGFILYGRGANGKSLVCKVLQGLMPKDTVVSVAPHNFRLPFHLGKLRNAWLNVVTEVYRSELKETETFKAVLSGDLITAEEKFKPAFNFKPRVSCVFAANSLPVVTDQTEGLWRKLTVVLFGVEIPVEEQDDTLDSKLLTLEKEGICAWAVAGAMRLLRNGKFTEPLTGAAIKDEWRVESDQAKLFIRDCCELAADDKVDTWTSASELYFTYKCWAQQQGHSALSSTNFGKRLKQIKTIKKRRTKKSVAYNLLLVEEEI